MYLYLSKYTLKIVQYALFYIKLYIYNVIFETFKLVMMSIFGCAYKKLCSILKIWVHFKPILLTSTNEL